MDAILGQLGLGSLGGDTTRSHNGCNSVDDLQRRLYDAVSSRRSEKRAEHVSANFEMLMNAVIHVVEEGPEPNIANGPEQLPEPIIRTVNASETILSQPLHDPILQRSVSKHLSGALGAVDDAAWIVRQVLRSAQGWTFKYQCKHSLQAWNRQNAKNPERPPIGAFSGNGGLDPVNLCKPQCICRGVA